MGFNYKSNLFKSFLCVLLLLAITTTVFEYTIKIREPYFGDVSYNSNEWLTSSTVKFTKNWYRENPVSLKFAMLENPRSIEFPTLESRDPYTSYPPGTIIPIYIISKINQEEPSHALVMKYNRTNHFFIAFILALIIFFFLLQLRIGHLNAFLFSIIPIMIELLLPGTLYWHQNEFFSDQAIILPFVLFIFLEVIRSSVEKDSRSLTIITIFQAFLTFYGVLTDWFFVFVVFVVYIKRLIASQIKWNNGKLNFIIESLKYWLMPIIAVFLFILQVYMLNSVNKTISKFLERSGEYTGTSTGSWPFMDVILKNINYAYGNSVEYAFIISIFVLSGILIFLVFIYLKGEKVDDDVKKILYLIGMLIIPCILQIFVFKNHSALHQFSILKLSPFIATVPFILLPILIYFILKNICTITDQTAKKVKIIFLFIFLVSSSVSGVLIAQEHSQYKNVFQQVDGYCKDIGTSIERNTGYNDIVFSPDLQIPENPPELLSYSTKRVYKANSLEEIKSKLPVTNEKYEIVILFENKTGWNEIIDKSMLIKDGNHYYYVLDLKYLK
ncbi:MAG: hypothetical protein HZC47_05940 [Methanobacterium sp.]|uniref:hypothetical protein n=1 Tax=Methanobacterium sp. TaxID=2164 RepID=UPI003D64D12A|nr:hypothetical protein [Methanobacterium sp.]